MFKKPFSFNGRIRRLEFGLSYIIYVVLYSGLTLIITETGELFPVLFLIIWLPLLWFLLAQGAKRCHDRGNSGWYQIIPFYGLWMLFADGDLGPNEYGDNPKGIGHDNEIDNIGKPIDDELPKQLNE